LNVGGQKKITVLRRTLTVMEGSLLAGRFSGNWDDTLEKDAEGNFYIDQDPCLFTKLIEYLRHKANEGIDSPLAKPPDLKDDRERQDFYRMVCYYGMKDQIYPASVFYQRHNALPEPHCCHPNVAIYAGPNSRVYLQLTNPSLYIRSFEMKIQFKDLIDHSSIFFGWVDKGVFSTSTDRREYNTSLEVKVEAGANGCKLECYQRANIGNKKVEWCTVKNGNEFIVQSHNLGGLGESYESANQSMRGEGGMRDGYLNPEEKVPFVSGSQIFSFSNIDLHPISLQRNH